MESREFFFAPLFIELIYLFGVAMNELDLWKQVPKLSVDEFMNLIFGLVPGTVKFDYGNPENWPNGAAIIYKLLTADIWAEKLFVTIDDPHHDPRLSEYFHERYGLSGNPWWADAEGKLSKRQLINWLEEKSIPSEFFGVPQAPLHDVEQESHIQLKELTPTLNATSIALTDSQAFPTKSLLSLPTVKKRVSTEGQEHLQVRNTCRENPEAVAYAAARQEQGATPEEIAAELKKAGAGVGVIGCILDPTKANVTSAREHGKYLLKKALK